LFFFFKVVEIVASAATQPPVISVQICETYLQFQEKSRGWEIRPPRRDQPGVFQGHGWGEGWNELRVKEILN